MDTFVQLALVGVTTGTIYGIVALGFSIIFTSSSILNFAQGEFVMVGGVVAALTYGATSSYVLAIAAALVAGTVTAGFVYGVAVRPLVARRSTPIVIVMATLATSIVIASAFQHFVGPSTRHLPPVLDGSLSALGVVVGKQNLLIVALTIPLVLGLWYVLYRTRVGLDIRAVGVDRAAAELLGVSTRSITLLGFLASGFLGALGGVLLTPILGANPGMGLSYAVTGFIAAVVGGIVNPFAALAGGVFVGILEAFISGYVSSSFTEVSVFLLLPVVLLLRPDGLFSPKTVSKR